MPEAKEKQNQIQFENYRKNPVVLGPYASHIYRTDPKHLGFLFARYKFVARMLAGKKKVLEVGCGDAAGTPLVAAETGRVYCTDWEPLLLSDNRRRLKDFQNISFSLLDITEKPFGQVCGGAFALDVIEHIKPRLEDKFIRNICRSLEWDGVCIIGTPNTEARKYASSASREGHVNLKSHGDLQKLLEKYFANTVLFSMNDEVVHTGYYKMAHYLLAVGAGKRKGKR